MNLVAIDTETFLIEPGIQAPEVVCASIATGDDPEGSAIVLPIDDAAPIIREIFADPNATVVGANTAFDVECLLRQGVIDWRTVANAYEANRVLDVALIERIAEIGGSTIRKDLSLASLARYYGVPELDKHGIAILDGVEREVRLSYCYLKGRPIETWPEPFIKYAAEDAIATVTVAKRQLVRFPNINISDVADLGRKALWLRVIANYGMTPDPDRVADLESLTNDQIEVLGALARDMGFVRDDGTRDMAAIRAAIMAAYDGAPPMTEEKRGRTSAKPFVPQVKTSKDVLQESGDPVLEAFAEYAEWLSVKNKDLEYLRKPVIHTKFGIADTTRTTSSKPNLQNLRRQSKARCECGAIVDTKDKCCGGARVSLGGIRECFVPRDGYLFVACDHGGLELATLAQCCVTLLGLHDMAGKLNRGEDLHSHVGAEMLGVQYPDFVARKNEPEFANARNCGKIVNFGCPGGMSAPTLVHFAKYSYGVTISESFAYELVEHWRRANPDGVEFLAYVKRRLKVGDRFAVRIPGTTIDRRGITYCSACNCHFQGLGAALEGAVGWRLLQKHRDPNDILSVCIPVMFIHDEFLWEVPDGLHTEAAEEIRRTMIDAAQPYLPDVRIDAEPSAMVRWSKFAKCKHGPTGELLVFGRDYN